MKKTIAMVAGATPNFMKIAPMVMRRFGLEWLLPVLQEARRMFKRYFIDDAHLFWLLLKECGAQAGLGSEQETET